MNRFAIRKGLRIFGWMTVLLLGASLTAQAAIDGITGTKNPDGTVIFNLVARKGNISTSDGDSFQMWGYAVGNRVQYPGPTLIVSQGDRIMVRLKNALPATAGNTSITFPGHQVSARGGVAGTLTREAPPDGATQVIYEFTATEPGTYLYRSGTRPDLQVEMGLVGALIVRPGGGLDPAHHAYNHADSYFDQEYLYFITEMDPWIHRQVEFTPASAVDTTKYFPTNWFINGRNWPDIMSPAFAKWLPTQPYNCVPRMHPGQKILVRLVGGGRDIHPMHLHGNNFWVIAEDGRMFSSNPGVSGADLAWSDVTYKIAAGRTADAIWSWNAEKLGWDIYGHAPGDPMEPGEYAPDHGKPFPVVLPTRDSMTFGPFYSGSPFLGAGGDLPPGDPGLNANAGYFYMWHSHTEKELTSNDIWPGGLVSFMIIEHPNVPIP